MKYILFPEILPRIKKLFFGGYSMLAYYVALIYGMARLIPAGHPYLNQANIGQLAFSRIIAVAWGNLNFKWKNVDQIILFFAVLGGIALSVLYIGGVFFFLTTAPAMAAPGLSTGWFTNAYPDRDIAFMMLDRMLGIPGVYDSVVTTTTTFGTMPTAFHAGLYALFAYFSWGMFGIAVVIFLYFIVEIVLETTMTGTPFGRHFENIWVPLRVIVGLGLLIPGSYGLNSAQWIVLYTAKFGSNFATNGWLAFNYAMDNPMGMPNEELVALPVAPDFTGIARDLFTIRSCKDVETRLEMARFFNSEQAPETYDPDTGEFIATALPKKLKVMPYFVKGDRFFSVLSRIGGTANGKGWPDDYGKDYLNVYLEGLKFYNDQDIKIVFGKQVPPESTTKWPGGIEPTCGEVTIPNFLSPDQKVPTGNSFAASDINEGILIGASAMFAVLKMTDSISIKAADGFGQYESGSEGYTYNAMIFATDRYFYQETAEGQRRIADRIEGQASGDPGLYDPDIDGPVPECPNDTDGDYIDDDGKGNSFPTLGRCTGPVDSVFLYNLMAQYQKYFNYGPIMGYDYYTNLGQQALNDRCTRISNDCAGTTGGPQSVCFDMQKFCGFASADYASYKPAIGVYYQDLGQDNPFVIKRDIASDLFKYGWGGAGIWYNMIAEKNGRLTGATNTLPRVSHFPLTMERVGTSRMANDANVSLGGCSQYDPATAGDTPISQADNVNDSHQLALLYYNLCKNVQQNESLRYPGTTPAKSGVQILDMINVLFGTANLFSFRENSIVNPLAQFAALGRALLDHAVNSFMIAAGGSAMSGLISFLGQSTPGDVGNLMKAAGPLGLAVSKMAMTLSTVGLIAGILLFYVLPMMPFMYFFFAVGAWVKTIFEALVGVPLWALAHIRLEGGPGFSGKAASGGYYLILEIFIRPFVTVFALIASLLVFMALAYVLNITWGVVTSNLVGYDPLLKMSNNPLDASHFRPRVDQLFFTVMYAVTMYLVATSTFKLIDLIPDNIMRWINTETKTIGAQDNTEEQVSNVSQTVAWPTYSAVSSIGGEVIQSAYTVGSGPGATMGSIRQSAEAAAKTNPTGGAK